MKFFIIFFTLIFLAGCSFDNKSGIWKNNNNITTKDKDIFSDFKTLSSSKKSFNKIIPLNENFNFNIKNNQSSFKWTDIFYSPSNNFDNFNYGNSNQLIFKSKKISNKKVSQYILFENNNIITSDDNGNLIIFSLDKNKDIEKFNFYKKKYKKFKIKLNIIVENNIIYVSDNLGFLYAFDYFKKKVIWAKNYKVPFRSNLKIYKNKIIAASQNNDLYFFNKKTGETISLIPTEETKVKNKFINNISISEDFSLYLNTYGSLYSIRNENSKINWFINLNQSLDLNPSNLFQGSQIVSSKNKIIISTNDFTYIIDNKTGSILHKKNFSSMIKPLLINNYLFIVTKNNFLISLNLENGSIIYSYEINEQVSDFLKLKKKKVSFKSMAMSNKSILIFLENAFVLQYNVNGRLEDIKKLPTKIKSDPIFIDKSLIYLDKKNKISLLN